LLGLTQAIAGRDLRESRRLTGGVDLSYLGAAMSGPPRRDRPAPQAGGPAEPPQLPARSLRIEADRAGHTLAAAVRAEYGELSWNRARELCRRGKVRVNDAVETDGARRLRAGDEVAIDPAGRRLHAQRLPDAAVLHHDRQLIVVDKPAGLLTIAFEPGEKDTLVDRARVWLRQHTVGEGADLGVVHRLDKDTTGVLVFSRTLSAKRHLEQLFRRHDVERRYLALVHGDLSKPRSIETDLIRDRGDGLRGSYGLFRRPRGPLPRDAQRALTHVRPLAPLRGATLIECRLHTGRQHQIRIHLSEIGHPLVGETVYIRDYQGERITAARTMLHATVLGFMHPTDDRPMRFEQPAPTDFTALLAQLRG
jgi:23S rRNA pseudouridine1911/1915/1917 synthase